MNEFLQRALDAQDFLSETARECEEEGRVIDKVADKLREIGVMRMLQPKEFGGAESTPIEFFETVAAIGSCNTGAGWISGVVGVHPWQIGAMDKKLQAEIWGPNGENADVWISSPYAPYGTAKPVDGGYRFSGRWPFGSGSENCDWAILGGVPRDDEGKSLAPPRHYVLPREDYDILDGTWEVMGLAGTGSKDILVKDAFIPEYRVAKPELWEAGEQATSIGRTQPLYQLPFMTIFGGTINAGTMAMAFGALKEFENYTATRTTVRGHQTKGEPAHMAALAEATADIESAWQSFLYDWENIWDYVSAGNHLDHGQRLRYRVKSVRGVRRCVDAVDKLFAYAGGKSLYKDQRMQMFWRDLHAGLTHICNVADPIYQAYGNQKYGLQYDRYGW